MLQHQIRLLTEACVGLQNVRRSRAIYNADLFWQSRSSCSKSRMCMEPYALGDMPDLSLTNWPPLLMLT